MNIWRVTGIVLVGGVALFLLSLLLKLLLVAGATFLLLRVAGGRLAGLRFGLPGRRDWSSGGIISIDNPAYRSSVNRAEFDRSIPIR